MTDLISVRKEKKSVKPSFIRQKSRQKIKLSKSWRRPKGLHSKLRLGKKGHANKPSSGWRSPITVRGLSLTGKREVLVETVGALKGIDKEKECVIIKSGLGSKKRKELLLKIKELGLMLINFKDIDAKVKTIDEAVDKRKQLKSKRTDKKKEKKKELEKKSQDKKSEDKEGLDAKVEEEGQQLEEKKAEDKKDKDRQLIKKDS